MGYRALALVMPLGVWLRHTVAVALLLIIAPNTLLAHPLHTSITILHYDREKQSIDLSIRVFSDDFERAASQRSARLSLPRNESSLLSYVRASFTVVDAAQRVVQLEWCGWRRQGDLLWLCFHARTERQGDITIADRLLHDLYDDQINIVQVSSGGRSRNLLFTKGERAKKLG